MLEEVALANLECNELLSAHADADEKRQAAFSFAQHGRDD